MKLSKNARKCQKKFFLNNKVGYKNQSKIISKSLRNIKIFQEIVKNINNIKIFNKIVNKLQNRLKAFRKCQK